MQNLQNNKESIRHCSVLSSLFAQLVKLKTIDGSQKHFKDYFLKVKAVLFA